MTNVPIFTDMNLPLGTEIEVATNGRILWVNGATGCLVRVQGLKDVTFTDMRESDDSKIMVKTQEELLAQQEGIDELCRERGERIHELETLLLEARTIISDLYHANFNGVVSKDMMNRTVIYLDIPIRYNTLKAEL